MKGCIAQRDKRISLQELDPNASTDGAGVVDKTAAASWLNHEDAYASVISRGGREFWKVDLVAADVSHVWTVDWTETLDAKTKAGGAQMRLLYEGLVYNVAQMVDVNLDHEQIEIQTTRQT
jgi:PHP family Zn ribbon phosphoesterase